MALEGIPRHSKAAPKEEEEDHKTLLGLLAGWRRRIRGISSPFLLLTISCNEERGKVRGNPECLTRKVKPPESFGRERERENQLSVSSWSSRA